jgi:hypothetical protein
LRRALAVGSVAGCPAAPGGVIVMPPCLGSLAAASASPAVPVFPEG